MKKLIKINKSDNVAVVLSDITAGEEIVCDDIRLTSGELVAAGHKIALDNIKKGDKIIKYGYPIGTATSDIPAGGWVHTHNLKSGLESILDYTYTPFCPDVKEKIPDTFMGYPRKDGKAGTRNEVWVIPTVGCVNTIARQIAARSQAFLAHGIDGIYAFEHPYGCSQLSDDLKNTQLALAGIIKHPNAAAVLVVGLGCENNGIGEMKKFLGDTDEHIKYINCQDEENEIETALKIMRGLCNYALHFRRVPCGTNKLTVGLKCGGSDGFSGITANPLTGAFSDILISRGGSAILTEVPEMFGAETILMNRCINGKVFERTIRLINDFKKYFIRYGQDIDSNPSPGNKAGGITTLEEKSLGCIEKGGTSRIVDVLDYGQPASKNGLSLLQAPGNDIVSSSALVISGAQLVLFTTGRGTPIGAPVPTIKISSTSDLFKRKPGWIDFDAGRLLESEELSALAAELYDYVIKVASGTKTKSEASDIREFAIFKDGVTL